jgi:acetoin utilization deacetylase AcuC-like enzyme
MLEGSLDLVQTFASDSHRAHHPRLPFQDFGRMVAPPEIPERVDRILAALRDAHLGEIRAPTEHGIEPVLAIHSLDYVSFLEDAHAEWRASTGAAEDSEAMAYARAIRDQPFEEPVHIIAKLGWYSHDTDPILFGTWAAARAAVDIALSAWDAVTEGRERSAYALCRPPGHHAAADSFAGYCYLNNAAIVANTWARAGARVALLDVDYHHGNGSQQIFYTRDDVLFASLHADPAVDYPFFLGFAHERGWGAGEGTNHNFPLPHGTDWARYAEALSGAMSAIRRFAPDALVVSLGVDTAAEDPDGFELVADDYVRMGEAIASLGAPTVFVQEGGYCLDVIGRNVANVLVGFEQGDG